MHADIGERSEVGDVGNHAFEDQLHLRKVTIRYAVPILHRPDLILYVAEQLSVDPATCVVIEDRLAGLEPGPRAGMQVIGCSKNADVQLTDKVPFVRCLNELSRPVAVS